MLERSCQARDYDVPKLSLPPPPHCPLRSAHLEPIWAPLPAATSPFALGLSTSRLSCNNTEARFQVDAPRVCPLSLSVKILFESLSLVVVPRMLELGRDRSSVAQPLLSEAQRGAAAADSEAGLEPVLRPPSPSGPCCRRRHHLCWGCWDPLPLRRGVGHRCLPQFMSLSKNK